MINAESRQNYYIKESAPKQTEIDEYDYESLDAPSDKLDGIGALVQMAKQGKIDPWNIDITDIADKYMLHLAECKSGDLRLSSRAWLFLAILLKLKSNVLAGIDTMQFTEPQEESWESEDSSVLDEQEEIVPYYGAKVISIQDIIQRRTSVKQNRQRNVTLKDLIRKLEFYEQLDRKERLQSTLEHAKRKVTSFKNLSAADIISIAQEDYITPAVNVLKECLIKIFEEGGKTALSALSNLGLKRTTAYMALLFLSRDGRCTLEQEEFYSELYVTKNEQMQPSAAQES